MNLLLTNDDGIDSDGLQKLAALLRDRGNHRVYVIAPDRNRSGVSHGLCFVNGPLVLRAKGKDSWSCSGYPADCVITGVLGALPARPELVISGINHGENVGTDIVYSGTAAGARQAAVMGIPGIALSLAGTGDYCWDMAVSWAADHLEELAGYWDEGSFVNVNIPNSAEGPLGIAVTWPGLTCYTDKLEVTDAPDGSRLCGLALGGETFAREEGTDNDAVSRNFVSVSTVAAFPAVIRSHCPGAPDYAALGGRSGKK